MGTFQTIHFDGYVLTYESRSGDDWCASSSREDAPAWEARTEFNSRLGVLGRLVLGIALAFVRQVAFRTETNVGRGSLALHPQTQNEFRRSHERWSGRDYCQR